MKARSKIYFRKKIWSRKYTPSHEYTIPGLQAKLDAAFFFSEFKPSGVVDNEAVAKWANKHWNHLADFTATREGTLAYSLKEGVVPIYIWNNSIKARKGKFGKIISLPNQVPPLNIIWYQGENDERSVATDSQSE